MLKNYIKLAWRVLGRHKFFTFISLFGISFTLGILMVILSFLQTELGADAPLTYKNDLVFLSQIKIQKEFFDTIQTIDTIYQNEVAIYDTTLELKSKGNAASQSQMNCAIPEKYLTNLPSTHAMTIFNPSYENDVFINGVKLTIDMVMADPGYWDVFDQHLLEGRTFDQTDMDNAAQVAVISTKLAEDYFGVTSNVLDREMVIDGKTFKVIGLYQHYGRIHDFVCPDALAPYSVLDRSKQYDFYMGEYRVMFRKKAEVSTKKLKAEIVQAGSLVPLDHPDNKYNFNETVFAPGTFNEAFAQDIYYDPKPEKSYQIMKWVLYAILLFFTILPTLNLINLNVSRIMDRSSEIGVRKAFGAHQGNIILQFIIENIVQTFLGGLLGLGLAYLIIQFINQGGYIGGSVLVFNTKFFIYSFLATLFFGILSGLLPALKMSRLQIVKALKENKL